MLYNEELNMLPGPDVVILDMYDIFIFFYRRIGELTRLELDLNELMDEMLMYLAEDTPAEYGLSILRRRVMELAIPISNQLEAQWLDHAISDLGGALIQTLRSNGLYSADRSMYYVFAGWADPFSPILRKELDTGVFNRDTLFYPRMVHERF